MKNTVCTLKPRAKKAIFETVEKAIENGLTKKECINAVCKKMFALGIVENSGDYNCMLSVALAFYALVNAKKDGKMPIDCLKDYAHFKRMASEKLSDFGAFGDTLETVLRISCKPSNLVSWNDLHVKRQGETDITIKGEKFEIGTNGKTFLESTEENAMNGKYEKVVYGVFDDTEKEQIFTMLENGDYKKAFENVRKMLYVFDKETFFECMTTKTGRGSMFQYKASLNKWQVIYNPSKHGLFLKMTENENIQTIEEYLKK